MKSSVFRPCIVLQSSPRNLLRQRSLLKPACLHRQYQTSTPYLTIRTQKLGDVGEGITECMLNMWFVEEGARVEEWDKLCEMQSDKAAVEISVNCAGVIKKLYAQANDMVKTGAPLADIDDGLPEDKQPPQGRVEERQGNLMTPPDEMQPEQATNGYLLAAEEGHIQTDRSIDAKVQGDASKGRSPATPAVRGLLKEFGLDKTKIEGSGKDGRILKEDVYAHLESLNATPMVQPTAHSALSNELKPPETAQALSPVQSQMFRTMTASLSIPHFLYADEVNTTSLSRLRRRFNSSRKGSDPKLTLLPFILKALSVSLAQYPLLNARVDTISNPAKPQLMYRQSHNIGIAIDTPAGLLVPVVKNAASLSVADISHEIRRLSDLGQARKLSNDDLKGGTITVSNVGNIGGTVVAPVIVEGQVTILGVGKSRETPAFAEDGTLEKAEVTNFSWSADHRVVDGATMARMGSMVKRLIEEPERLMVQMR